MRKLTKRTVLLIIGISAFVLAEPTAPAHAAQAAIANRSGAKAKINQPAPVSYARHWRRSQRASAVSLRVVRPRGHISVYKRYRRPSLAASDAADRLLDCLFSQPFVICP
jgi:hypothetical protein